LYKGEKLRSKLCGCSWQLLTILLVNDEVGLVAWERKLFCT